MWTFSQSLGDLRRNDALVACGYAGAPEAKNNPDAQDQRNVGPLPRGLYRIGPADRTTHLGPIVFALTPDSGNEMYGRSAFLIHWDSKAHPGAASQGCIVLVSAAAGGNPMPAFTALEVTQDRWLAVVR